MTGQAKGHPFFTIFFIFHFSFFPPFVNNNYLINPPSHIGWVSLKSENCII